MKRTIVWNNYGGFNEHLYEDQLGFTEKDRQNAGGLNTARDIFITLLDECHFELGFFHVDSGKNYFIATLEKPIQLLELPRDTRKSQFAEFQCDSTAYEFGNVIATFEKAEDIWNNFRIDGKSMEDIISRSYITWLC